MRKSAREQMHKEADTGPTKEELDALAAEIREQAKAEAAEEVRARLLRKHRERIEQIRGASPRARARRRRPTGRWPAPRGPPRALSQLLRPPAGDSAAPPAALKE
jgi:hypothetical protein